MQQNKRPLMAIDPGITTGVVLRDDCGDFQGFEITTYAEMSQAIADHAPEIIIIENFIVRQGKPSLYHPSIRMIGVVEYLCGLAGIEFVVQSPSILQSSKYRSHYGPLQHKSPHVGSALQHLLYYIGKHEVDV